MTEKEQFIAHRCHALGRHKGCADIIDTKEGKQNYANLSLPHDTIGEFASYSGRGEYLVVKYM